MSDSVGFLFDRAELGQHPLSLKSTCVRLQTPSASFDSPTASQCSPPKSRTLLHQLGLHAPELCKDTQNLSRPLGAVFYRRLCIQAYYSTFQRASGSARPRTIGLQITISGYLLKPRAPYITHSRQQKVALIGGEPYCLVRGCHTLLV